MLLRRRGRLRAVLQADERKLWVDQQEIDLVDTWEKAREWGKDKQQIGSFFQQLDRGAIEVIIQLYMQDQGQRIAWGVMLC